MPMLNARCDTCGTVFPSGIFVENSTNVSFSGNKSGPCPRCRGMGSLIANNTTMDFIANRVTVKKGWLSPEDLAVVASSFERFQVAQDNRPQVEEQIAQVFPQLQSRVQRLSNERLLLLISFLLTIMATWQTNLPAVSAALQQAEQALSAAQQVVQKAEDQTLAEAFEAYESGKQSLHAMKNKILRFFPELEKWILDMSYADTVATLLLIIDALERWKPREKLKDFRGSEKQIGELINEIKGMRADLKDQHHMEPEDSKRP